MSGFTEQASLQIENAGSNPNKGFFSSQSNPTGTAVDWFRYRTDLSTSSWDLSTRGTMLLGLWWRNTSPSDRSGFFDHAERPVLRVHKYEGEVTPPITVTAGLEVMRPDESPASSPAVTKNISLTQPVVACFEPESTSTWRLVDQFFDATCSEGANLEYSWDTGSGFGPYSSSSLFEFFGHGSQGTKIVKLRVRDIGQSPVVTADSQRNISVQSPILSLNGPSFVTDKQTKTYTASTLSDWYERYDPENLVTWYFTLNNATTYNRIWPAGEYTRGLRAEKTSQSPLGRGRIDVEVCHESIPGCSPQFIVFSGASTATSPPPDDWGLFGLGPWVASVHGVARFYDLTGLHEQDSPFSDLAWLHQVSGSATAKDGVAVGWAVSDDGDPFTRIVDLVVTPVNATPYRFGMAIDPDLGSSPADDQSGFDPNRRMAYVYDGSEAVGFMLLRGGENDIVGIEQYGARRFAPRAAPEAMQAGTSRDVRLLNGEDDVQFILSTDEASGPGSWRFVVIRGGSPAELRKRADAFLSR